MSNLVNYVKQEVKKSVFLVTEPDGTTKTVDPFEIESVKELQVHKFKNIPQHYNEVNIEELNIDEQLLAELNELLTEDLEDGVIIIEETPTICSCDMIKGYFEDYNCNTLPYTALGLNNNVKSIDECDTLLIGNNKIAVPFNQVYNKQVLKEEIAKIKKVLSKGLIYQKDIMDKLYINGVEYPYLQLNYACLVYIRKIFYNYLVELHTSSEEAILTIRTKI